ncbi:MAG: pseudouridine synthase family protein [Minisyncoccota bacterium]
MSIITIYKKIGETPLEALTRLRENVPEYKEETLSYAGRLDPMAAGVMLVLAGDANKEREKYLNLEKDYSAEILFGISTDTYDTLGLITEVSRMPLDIESFEDEVRGKMLGINGTFSQKYPEYSSKPVDGQPLFMHARAGKRVSVPVHDVTIFGSELKSVKVVDRVELLSRIESQIGLVKGDFRQKDIVSMWKQKLEEGDVKEFFVAEVDLSVSSGFYVRQYAYDLGISLGVPACALSILRTRVGEFSVGDCVM